MTGGSPVAAPALAPLVAAAGFRLAAPAEALNGRCSTVGLPRAGSAAPLPAAAGPPGSRTSALRPHFGAKVCGDAQGVSGHALASRRGLTVGSHGPAVRGPSRALGAPPAWALAWLPFSRTPVMPWASQLGAGRDSEASDAARQTDAVDQFVARGANGYKAEGFSRQIVFSP